MLTQKEQLRLKRYEKDLAMPRWKYIFFYGVLLWGITVLIITVLIDRFIFKEDIRTQWNNGLLGKIIMMPFAGIFFGWFMRKIIEKQVIKLKKKENIN